MTKPLIDSFRDFLCASIDEKGVEIPHGLMLHDDDTLTVFALHVPPAEGYMLMLTQWVLKQPNEAIFGFDRYAKLGQGTTLGDLIAGHHFVRGAPSRSFIVEYQHDPRIVQPFDWSNAHWNAALGRELVGAMHSLRKLSQPT